MRVGRLACVMLVACLMPYTRGRSKFDYVVSSTTEPMTDKEARVPYTKKNVGMGIDECNSECFKDSARTINEQKVSGNGHQDGIHEIFLVPHTHDDVGWLYTVGGYFNKSVRSILDSVTADLAIHPEHKFIWSEIKWIEMWWPLQNDTTRTNFKKIVANGQLEFVGAGWSQHDEVTPSYRDMIANTVTGHEYLRHILGPLDKACPQGPNGATNRCVRFGWQIDMFAGYSAASPSLWTMAGYDGMVIRFEGPNSMRSEWDNAQLYEYIWEPSKVLPPSRSSIATHVIRWNYGDMLLTGRNGSAYGFRGPDVSFDFSTKVLYTQTDIEFYADALVRWSKGRGSVYRGNRHLAPWGSDFQFTDANLWFQQMDLLIQEINSNPEKYNAHIRYSTLATYFDNLYARNHKQYPDALLPVLKDLDFEFGWPHTWAPIGIPLIGLTQNFSWQYQTGAASSRPAHKQRVRNAASQLRAAQTILAWAVASKSVNVSETAMLEVASDALGITQHHDSLPATMQAKESLSCPPNFAVVDGLDACNCTTDPDRLVLEDYTRRLEEANNATILAMERVLAKQLNLDPASVISSTSRAKSLAADAEYLVVVNPTLHSKTQLVRVSFDMQSTALNHTIIPTLYRIDSSNSSALSKIAILAQMKVNDEMTSQLTNSRSALPFVANSLYFVAALPPLGSARYTLEFDASGLNSTTTQVPEVIVGKEKVAEIGLAYDDKKNCLHANFSSSTGLLKSISTNTNNDSCSVNASYVEIHHTFYQYVDPNGGAYCLIEQTRAVELPPPFRVTLTRGPIFQEVSQSFSFGNGLQQRTRLLSPGFQDSSMPPMLDIIQAAGRLPQNRELISRFKTNLDTQGTLYTEASGMSELYSRAFNSTASVGQNYHAMVQTAAIRGMSQPRNQLTILSRRTMGVASLGEGEIEIMTMRRISSASDNQGPWPLDDKLPMKDHLRIIFATESDSELARFPAALDFEERLIVLHEPATSKVFDQPKRFVAISGIPKSIWGEFVPRVHGPQNATLMLRLQNIVTQGDSVTIPSISSVLGSENVSNCLETTLTMQQTKQDNDRLRFIWKQKVSDTSHRVYQSLSKDSASGELDCHTAITLGPLDIRTFTFEVQ